MDDGITQFGGAGVMYVASPVVSIRSVPAGEGGCRAFRVRRRYAGQGCGRSMYSDWEGHDEGHGV
jgi:hypothetical protein